MTSADPSSAAKATAMAAYVLALDWHQAHGVVQESDWLRTPSALAELREKANLAAQAAADQAAEPATMAFAHILAQSYERLSEASVHGTDAAFVAHARRDLALLQLVGTGALEDAARAACEEPWVLEDDTLAALDVLRIRAGVAQVQPRYEAIEGVANFLAACRDGSAVASARTIANQLQSIPANHVTPQVVAQCQIALALVNRKRADPAWAELQARMGALLLERRDGDRVAHVERAQRAYAQVIDEYPQDSHESVWRVATHGLLNCLLRHPLPTAEHDAESDSVFNDLASDARARGDEMALASLLNNYASAVVNRSIGDVMAHAERALGMQQEAVQLLNRIDGNESEVSERRARFLHNLGVLYLKRKRGVPSQNVDSAIAALRAALVTRRGVSRIQTLLALAQAYPAWSGAASYAQALDLAHNAQHAAEQLMTEHNVSADRFGAAADLSATAYPLRHLADCTARGQAAHSARDFQTALSAFSEGLEIGEASFLSAGTSKSQRHTLQQLRGLAALAAYAAARIGQLEQAVRLAEHGCARSLLDALITSAARVAALPRDVREQVSVLETRIRTLEAELEAAEQTDAHSTLDAVHRSLADALGVQPSALGVRITSAGTLVTDNSTDAFAALSDELALARQQLRELMSQPDRETPALPLPVVVSDVRDIAETTDTPLVYLTATMHGSVGLVVTPDRSIHVVELPDITSDHTMALLQGDSDRPGYARVSVRGETASLADSVSHSVAVLARTVAHPLQRWLADAGFTRATLIPLGSLGLLPLTAAFSDPSLVVTLTPSARALQHVAPKASGARHDDSSKSSALEERVESANAAQATPPTLRLVAVGDPRRDDMPPLPATTAEVRSLVSLFESKGYHATPLLAVNATEAALRSALHPDVPEHDAGSSNSAGDAAICLHAACHAEFRSANPLQSGLLLAGDDTLSIGDLWRHPKTLGNVRLAVLMACQTATKEADELPDESTSLPSSLLLAGIPAVVCTLWPVHELPAALFSMRFYHELLNNSTSPARAVASARHWLCTSTAPTLRNAVLEMCAALADEDHDAMQVLDGFANHLMMMPEDTRPLEGVQHSGAFALVGLG